MNLSPMTAFTALAAVGLAGMALTYVVTGFVLDDAEKALAARFLEAPTGKELALGDVVTGDWTNACVLNTEIADPGKTKQPDLMPGMLIPPMRHHATFLKSGFWLIVTLDQNGAVLSEARIDPAAIANRAADNGGNFCAARADLSFRLEPCEADCERRIVFAREDAPATPPATGAQ